MWAGQGRLGLTVLRGKKVLILVAVGDKEGVSTKASGPSPADRAEGRNGKQRECFRGRCSGEAELRCLAKAEGGLEGRPCART